MPNGMDETQDERANQAPTPEEIRAAQLAKTQQALALSDAMRQGERALTQGRIYMGPTLSPEQEMAFRSSAPGTRVILAPPPSPDVMAQRAAAIESVPGAQTMQDVEMWRRVAARDTPYSRTLPGVTYTRNAAQNIFDAQRNIERAIAGGMTPADAMQLYGMGLFGGKGAITPYQSAQLQLGRERLAEQQRANMAAMAERGARPVAPPRWERQDAARWDTLQKESERLRGDINILPDDPFRAQSFRRLRQIQDEQQAIESKYSRPTTTTGTLAAPTATGRVRVRNPDGKIGTIPASQLQDALASGWSRM